MAIQLVSAQFVQSYRSAQPGNELRAPFAPLSQGLGTGPVNPKATAVSPGETSTTPAVLVSSLIRPRILLENPRPLQIEAVLQATAGESSARVRVRSSLPSLGSAHASQGFPDLQTISLTLDLDDANPSAVADESVTLFWEFESGGVVETATTSHRLLITLGAPRSPWGMDPNKQSQWIWQEVVELACKWASGAQSNDEATRLIAAAVFGLGNEPEATGLRYGGYPQYCLADTFDCAGFLRHLKGDPSTGANVNCMDTSAIVSTFANVLGCSLLQAQCNRGDPRTGVMLIGNVQPMHFSFHELAWSGTGAIADPVADGCVSVNGETLPPLPFHCYGERVFVASPERIGQTFPENRQIFQAHAFTPTMLDDNVIDRVRHLHPELAHLDLAEHGPESHLAWVPPIDLPGAPPIVGRETAWEFFLAPAESLQTKARISTFPTSEEATRYFYMRLGGFSCRLVQWPTPAGVAVSGENGKTVVYKRDTLVAVIQLQHGERDLRGALEQVTALLTI